MRRLGSTGPDVATGLMVARLRPAPGKDMEFNWWYDTEHAPFRWGVPGFLTARRYQAIAGWDGTAVIDPELRAAEEAEPRGYLAYYDLDDLSVLDGRAYLSYEDVATPNEREVLASLTDNDRRTYTVVPFSNPAANDTDLDVCAPFVMFTSWDVLDDGRAEFEKWYEEEHVPMLMQVPGWMRIRRFERTEPGEGRFMAIHDLSSLEVFDEPAQAAAASTPWRARAIEGRVNFQRRLYRLWRRFDG